MKPHSNIYTSETYSRLTAVKTPSHKIESANQWLFSLITWDQLVHCLSWRVLRSHLLINTHKKVDFLEIRREAWSGLHSWHWLLLTFWEARCEMESSQISQFSLIDGNICYTVKRVNMAGVGIRYHHFGQFPGQTTLIFRFKVDPYYKSGSFNFFWTVAIHKTGIEGRQLTWHWFLIIFLYKTKNVGCSFKQTSKPFGEVIMV